MPVGRRLSFSGDRASFTGRATFSGRDTLTGGDTPAHARGRVSATNDGVGTSAYTPHRDHM
jgi:hypothetical protein